MKNLVYSTDVAVDALCMILLVFVCAVFYVALIRTRWRVVLLLIMGILCFCIVVKLGSAKAN